MKNIKAHILTLIFLALIAYIATPKIVNIIKGPAGTPTLFAANYTIEQATAHSIQTGKPMLVLVTADWCPPCQALKRGALSDSAVNEWVSENMIPVYLEDGVNQDQIRMLPVNSYPTTLVIQDGSILGQFSGNKSASSFLSRIKDFASKS